VRESHRAWIGDGPAVVVALSGGRDSVALLDLLCRLRDERAFPLSACHVHHGLRAAADAWAEFCGNLCAQRGLSLEVARVEVVRAGGESLEENARALRYAALARTGADVVALAHHLDDQVETVLLQLLRGAGARGLAGMAEHAAGTPALWRPLLGTGRAAIEAYCRERSLAWVDDDSNTDPAHRRNALRVSVLPEIAAKFPGYREAIGRAAHHQAGAARLLDELAAIDAGAPLAEGVALQRLRALSHERAGNVLRALVAHWGLRPPSTARLNDWLRQLADGRSGSPRLPHEGAELGVHDGRVLVHAPAAAPFDLLWDGSPTVALGHGELRFLPRTGEGIRAAALAGLAVRIRSRAGGERMRLAAHAPSRSLKNLLQERGVPAWERPGLPLIFAGRVLVAVGGIGVAAGYRAAPGEEGILPEWIPAGIGPGERGRAWWSGRAGAGGGC
jgi:tRNA(Ile)-lysidine synthase